MYEARIFLPAFTMAALTCTVWLRMLFTRVAEMNRERIHPQSVALSVQAASKFRDTRAADNFRNLFELPVLFYLAMVIAALTSQVTLLTLSLAWLFVALRVVHSVIQCGHNKVMHRFKAYVGDGAALCVLWIVLAIGLLLT